MFTILFGALAVIVLVLMCFGIYIFAAYVFSRLGEKFRIGSSAEGCATPNCAAVKSYTANSSPALKTSAN